MSTHTLGSLYDRQLQINIGTRKRSSQSISVCAAPDSIFQSASSSLESQCTWQHRQRIGGIEFILVEAYLRRIDKISARGGHPHEYGVLVLGHIYADGPAGDASRRMIEARCVEVICVGDKMRASGGSYSVPACRHSRCLGPIDNRPALACRSGPTPLYLGLIAGSYQPTLGLVT